MKNIVNIDKFFSSGPKKAEEKKEEESTGGTTFAKKAPVSKPKLGKKKVTKK